MTSLFRRILSRRTDAPDGAPDGARTVRAPDPLTAAIDRVSAATTTAEVIAALAATARGVVGSDGICIVERIGDEVEYLTEDAISPLWAGQRFPVAMCVSGQALTTRAPIFIPDIMADRRVPLNAYLATFVRSMAVVPIGTDAPRFALGAYWRAARPIAPIALDRIGRLASAGAAALARIEGPGDSRQVA